jgi:hypothetical protein
VTKSTGSPPFSTSAGEICRPLLVVVRTDSRVRAGTNPV